MTTDAINTDRQEKTAPRYVVISAWAAPILVLTGWALLAAVPIAVITWATWAETRVRALRWWSSLLALAYGIPLALYLSQDTVPSLSKMLDPLMTTLIVLPALVLIAKLWKSHRG